MDDSQLKKDAPNNFWNSCPLRLEYLPETECDLGKPILKNNKVPEDPRCEWWINSKKHNYCFWKYINENSDYNGNMKELLQADLAKLFGCSSTKIHFVLKEAMFALKEAFLDADLNNSVIEGENVSSFDLSDFINFQDPDLD